LPWQIRYWVANKGKLAQTVQVAIGAATGKGTAPGELRTITPAEVNLCDFQVEYKSNMDALIDPIRGRIVSLNHKN
jgi:hypothetical protein